LSGYKENKKALSGSEFTLSSSEAEADNEFKSAL